jgi:vacuolar protein sorting-associated protein 13A/C
MRKLLVISNAGIYWNAHENNILSNKDDKVKIEIMSGMILREGESKTL